MHRSEARSFRSDIERLRRHSSAILARLADYGAIPLGADRIEIERPYRQTLHDASEQGSILVVGEPGAGKSGVLYGLARSFESEGRDVIVLAAQDPPFSSLSELRDELGLEHDIADVLANWQGDRPAFLLIDALDAARTDLSAQALRRLMRDVMEATDRWRVVASIREYDVRYGRDVRRLFAGPPPKGTCPSLPGSDFQNVRHLVVGRLTGPEIDQLASKSPRLYTLVTTAPPRLAELFTNAFNLRLAAELLDSGTQPEAIRAVQSQLDLLDLYWGERVLGAGDPREAHAREAVLRRAVDGMVSDRTLRVDVDRVAGDPAASPALTDLLRAHVLTEWAPVPGRAPDRSTLTFAHHVLFDYAVARLLLRRAPKRLAELLSADPAFVLLARPSVLMHFHHLWDLGHAEVNQAGFWESVLAISAAEGIPEIGKIVGPSVAAGAVQDIREFESLLAALNSAGERGAAENALDHLVRSLIVESDGGAPAAGTGFGPWSALVERVSRQLKNGTAYSVRALLAHLTERVADLGPGELADIGTSARRLLEFAWGRPQRDRWLVIHALQNVCSTFSTDPAASGALLRRAIERGHLAAHGSEELRWVADEVTTLVEHDPALVRDIYAAAYGYQETSDAPTPMGGIVMPLVSNRRQDYGSALYSLGRAFPAFLERAPEHAVSALNSALEAHVARDHPHRDEQVEARFEFDGREARILADYSYIWDRGRVYPDEKAVELLNHLQSRLGELAGDDGDLRELRRILTTIVAEVRLAGVWRRLLRLGAGHPRTLGLELRSLAWAAPILSTPDTSTATGELIRTIAPHLPLEDRERIERAIVALPVTASSKRVRDAEETRDRLLGCLLEVEPVTEEARQRLAVLREQDAVPPNEDDRPWIQMSSGTYGEEEFLADEGVAVDEEPNRRIRELEAPASEFASKFMNEEPSASDISAILPHLRTLHRALQAADTDGVHPEQASYAWGNLADACASVAKAKELPCSGEAGSFARGVLLEASRHPVPKPDPEGDAEFDRPHWSKPAPRIDAAEGLMSLAFDPTCSDDEVLEALDRLSRDPVPAVRYQIAARLHGLFRSAPDRCWVMLERMASEERSRGVLGGLLQGPLIAMRFLDPERVSGLVLGIFARVEDDPKEVRNESADVLVGLYLWKDFEPARRLILEMAEHPVEHSAPLSHLVPQLRELIIHGAVSGSDPEDEAARGRAIDFLTRVTRSASRAFREAVEVQDGSKQGGNSPALDEDQLSSLAHLLDNVGSNLYFASGAFDGGEAAGPEDAVQARLLRELGPVIDELAEVGLPSVSHHLLETLEVLASFDPGGVFMRIAAVIRGGRKAGYQYDRMAENAPCPGRRALLGRLSCAFPSGRGCPSRAGGNPGYVRPGGFPGRSSTDLWTREHLPLTLVEDATTAGCKGPPRAADFNPLGRAA